MLLSELLTDESKWTKGVNARDSSGNPISCLSDKATCFCLVGATFKCNGDESPDKVYKVMDKISDEIKFSISEWNDAPERTFQEVKDLVVKLGI